MTEPVRRLLVPVVLALCAGLFAGALVRLPVAWLSPLLPESPLSCRDPAGSLWRGQCGALLALTDAGPLELGRLTWSLRPVPLLRGSVVADLRLVQAAGEFQGRVSRGATGVIRLEGADGRLDLGAGGLPPALQGWSGSLRASGLSATWEDGALRSVQGRVESDGLVRNRGSALPLGGLNVVFTPSPSEGPEPRPVAEALVDSRPDNPLGIRGRLVLRPGGEWVFDGRVAGGPGVPASLERQLALLGTPDAQGYRPFSLSGTY